ncbi:MAG: hypothetical protein WKG01_19120 [Kofleriaceae bacterium]
MRRAVIDPRLEARVISRRSLAYTTGANVDEDIPAHVRAASGVVVRGDHLLVIQDDMAVIAAIGTAIGATIGSAVEALALPRGPGDRRRFEVALGNKLDKLDLEAALLVDDELWAFGSGSLPVRERIVRVRGSEIEIVYGASLYAAIRATIGGALNIEGVAHVADQLWLFHRGNTGARDPGPAVVRIELAEVQAWLAGGPTPDVSGVDRYDLGAVGGVRLGFTDAVARGARVYYVAAAEASPDAIADGAVLGSLIGVIDGDSVRCAPLCDRDGAALKVEGLALIDDHRGWITLDPDDVDVPAPLCEILLHGPW